MVASLLGGRPLRRWWAPRHTVTPLDGEGVDIDMNLLEGVLAEIFPAVVGNIHDPTLHVDALVVGGALAKPSVASTSKRLVIPSKQG